MFDRLMKRPHSLARHRNGPLEEERLRYLAHCAEQQMSRDSLRRIASNTLLIARILRLANRPGELISRSEIAAAADRWVNRRSRQRPVRNIRLACRTLRGHAVRWLSFLGRLQSPATVQGPYADRIAQFTDYLLRERGLSPRTIAYSRQAIQDFLTQIDKADLQLRTLSTVQLDAVVAQKVRDSRYGEGVYFG